MNRLGRTIILLEVLSIWLLSAVRLAFIHALIHIRRLIEEREEMRGDDRNIGQLAIPTLSPCCGDFW